ncbi:MAG: TonB-dependent receptor [Bacteroidales bacterium]|nr:TonB-dependent receptor [Lentimicrobiaceae bacterium]MDD5694843.1 TonB-dependent receptor [Bacteroidales bacterium]
MVIFILYAYAQKESDTAVLLPEVSVNASRLFENTTGLTVHTCDSTVLANFQNRMLTDLITQQTSLQVQSYNPGNLATISFRGTSSNHTGFLWNGISLNPVSSGMTDLSLLPVALFDRIYILHGGASSVFGEGNIGGGIHLVNEPDFIKHKEIRAGIEFGSFQSLRSSLTAELSGPKWSLRAGGFLVTAENAFPFTNDTQPDKPIDTMNHARQKGMGLMGTFSCNLKKHSVLVVDLWYQFMDREIPGSLMYRLENADQHDRFVRSMITWRKTLTRSVLNVKAAYFNDYLHYTELYTDYPEFDIDAKSWVQTFTGEVSDKFRLSDRIELHGTALARYAKVKSGYYTETKDQFQGSLFLAAIYTFTGVGWKMDLNLHQGWTEDYAEPFTPSFGAEGPLFRFLNMKMNISHNFRSPTLNERYWQPGGNPDLKPEKSWNEEITFYVNDHKEALPVVRILSVTFFHSMINDWIRWVPLTDDPYMWSPQNVQKVRSAGLESRVALGWEAGKFDTFFQASYSFTRSINENKESPEFKKQLPYVAEHTGLITAGIAYSKAFLDYTQTFTGSRATVEDHSEMLPRFSIGRLRIGYGWDLKKCILDFYFRIDNVFNVDYQVVRYYPNPGISFTGGVGLKVL